MNPFNGWHFNAAGYLDSWQRMYEESKHAKLQKLAL